MSLLSDPEPRGEPVRRGAGTGGGAGARVRVVHICRVGTSTRVFLSLPERLPLRGTVRASTLVDSAGAALTHFPRCRIRDAQGQVLADSMSGEGTSCFAHTTFSLCPPVVHTEYTLALWSFIYFPPSSFIEI